MKYSSLINCVFLLLLILCTLPVAQTRQDTLRMANEFISKAQKAIDEEQYVMARVWSNKFLTLIGENQIISVQLDTVVTMSRPYRLISSSFVAQAKYDSAISPLSKAISIDSSDYEMALKGISMNRKQHESISASTALTQTLEAAETFYKWVTETYPKSMSILYKLRGLVYRQLDNYDNAIRDLTKSISLDSSDVEVFYLRGKSYEAMGNYKNALPDYNRAIEISPRKPDYWLRRAITFEQLEQYDQALKDIDQTIKLAPDDATAYFTRGFIYKKLNLLEKAIQDYTNALKKDPDNCGYLKARFVAYEEYHDYQKAIHDFEPLLQTDTSLDAHAIAEEASRFLDDDKGLSYSIELLSKAKAKLPDSLILYVYLSSILNLNRQFSSAIAICNQAPRENNNISPKILLRLAHAYLFQGNFNRAKSIYLENRDVKIGDKTFRELTIMSFDDFRKHGLNSPDMAKIENLLRLPEK